MRDKWPGDQKIWSPLFFQGIYDQNWEISSELTKNDQDKWPTGHGIRTKLKMTKINYQFGHGIRFKLKMTT